jgi:small-conductance mechanosensitive channel
MRVSEIFRRFGLSLMLLLGAGTAFAEDADAPTAPAVGAEETFVRSAPVIIDGRTLFTLRGISAHPADQRASEVAGRIRALARDPSLDPSTLAISHEALYDRIVAGENPVVRITDADAEAEEIDRRTFADVCLRNIREAVVAYRAARTREALVSSAWRGAVATVIAALAFVLALRLIRALNRWIQRRVAERVKAVTVRSFEVVRAERIRAAIEGALRFLAGLSLILIAFLYIRYVLGLLPWTQGAAAQIDGWVFAPIAVLGSGMVAKLPDIVFLIVLFFVVRYTLRLIGLFFAAVGRGDVKLESFDPDWALPTFKILRLAIVAFAVIVAYPYIPGSSSAAFKGVSLFLGVVFSLGSSSAISNVVAGYTMIYRRAFHEGDMVKIGDVTGIVSQIRVQVTHLRTVKNEEVIVPNSTIMGAEVINYSSLARSDGLILHTTVGIGYETPWRQVEAMLIDAAGRTPGVLEDPKPFVLATALGDFAITYQINAYTAESTRMARLYNELHRNILDVFNEHGVQIMTPAYEGDPEEPKIVPKDKWQWPPPAKT